MSTGRNESFAGVPAFYAFFIPVRGNIDPNMWLAGSPALAIIASVTLVNSRQLLYGASLSRFCGTARKKLSFLFGATVTDESFAVNLGRFEKGSWSVGMATAVNICCQTTWALANVAGWCWGRS